MHIVLVCSGRLPAVAYGGTERVAWCLGKELARRGHKVTFLAGRGSSSPFGEIIEIDPDRDLFAQLPASADIAHFNCNVPEGAPGMPHLVTIHGNEPGPEINRNAVFVSGNHAERFGSDSYVYNGLDWDDYGKVDLGCARRGYHFLGNAAWSVKNVGGAIRVVNKLRGERLVVMGGSRINLKMGIKVHLSPAARFEGMVDDGRKKYVAERSRGLIFPVTWHEPFGLAITESLYFGAPVFATPYGSLPELVTPEVGYLTDSCSDMVRFLKEGNGFSPGVCHEYARDVFNASVMTDKYLEKYETVLSGRYLNDTRPERRGPYRDLPWKP